MFDVLTDEELITLWRLMDDATYAVYRVPWTGEQGNRKAAYHGLLSDLDNIATEVNGVRASRLWR